MCVIVTQNDNTIFHHKKKEKRRSNGRVFNYDQVVSLEGHGYLTMETQLMAVHLRNQRLDVGHYGQGRLLFLFFNLRV